MNVVERKPSSPSKIPYGIRQKTVARLAAIQALYSADITETVKAPAQLVLEALHYHTEDEGSGAVTPDEKYLKKLIYGVSERKEEVDGLIRQHLGEGWDIERLGGVMRSLLRVAVCELLECENVTLKTLINEYITLSRGFFNEPEVKFVNGILDKIGHKVRG